MPNVGADRSGQISRPSVTERGPLIPPPVLAASQGGVKVSGYDLSL